MKYAELCAGYGGLSIAVEQVFGAELAWYSEYDHAASKIMATHWPDAPNYGDMTRIDWAAVPKVDILSGGTPCQDLSHAGRRQGMTEGTRSNLWVQMREAIATIRPRFVVWENVAGAYSAAADSAVEYCAGCMGNPTDGHLRALGRVLGDLAELGFDAEWRGLRAADVGAPHGRKRVFILAQDADRADSHQWWHAAPGQAAGWRSWADAGGRSGAPTGALMPTPAARDWKGCPGGGYKALSLPREVAMLPTPRATDGTKGGPGQRGSKGDLTMPSAVLLLPTPRTENNENRQAEGYGGNRGNFHGLITGAVSWGDYEPAIRRWEQVLDRPAPSPTEPNTKGNPRLSPSFVEWLMGLPAGWVTDVPISRNDQLKALGNGVVSLQAAVALADMLNAFQAAAA